MLHLSSASKVVRHLDATLGAVGWEGQKVVLSPLAALDVPCIQGLICQYITTKRGANGEIPKLPASFYFSPNFTLALGESR